MLDMCVSSSSAKRLIWGVFHNLVYALLASQCSVLLRICTLTPQHTLGFIFIGQFLSNIMFFPIAWRKWSIRTKGEWIAYCVAGLLKGVNLVLWRIGSQNMPLGDYAAIDVSGVMFAPILASIIRRKCVKIIDIFGVLIAAVGILLLTKPTFILPSEQPEIANSIGYFCAAYGGFTTMILPFVLGHFSYVHWTNFLCVGVMSTGFISVLYLTIAGWDLPPASDPLSSSSSSSSSSMSVTSIVAAVLVGLITTVYRICQIFACNELESLSIGMAGLMGNVINAGIIPFTAFLALAFFNEELGEVEAIGASLLFFAIVVLTITKFRISANEKSVSEHLDAEKALLKGSERSLAKYLDESSSPSSEENSPIHGGGGGRGGGGGGGREGVAGSGDQIDSVYNVAASPSMTADAEAQVKDVTKTYGTMAVAAVVDAGAGAYAGAGAAAGASADTVALADSEKSNCRPTSSVKPNVLPTPNEKTSLVVRFSK